MGAAVRTILLNKSVYADNDAEAELLRQRLKAQGTYLVNVMSSPGAGKTTTLIRLIRMLKDEFSIGVMEADIDSDKDAVQVAAETGVASVQLHTDGMCHLDAGMTAQGLAEMEKGLDLVFLENVGNLVCPAEYDTGAHMSITILSVPEGDDKPLKYPLIFEKSSLVVISKIDALPYFDFSLEKVQRNILCRNRDAKIIPVSAKTGEGMEELAEFFRGTVKAFKAK
ncbi:MAG: hydrogenase nickel incorporation protein HypB [Clostridia bacterium]|nr:hydrogenase nickel incorporation protein HypB [Clostridia bacterium]